MFSKYYRDAWEVVVVLLAIVLAAFVVLWAGQAAGEKPDQPTVEVVVSPWEGMFCAAPQGQSEPFVTAGSYVTPDTVVGMIDLDVMRPQRRIEVFAGVRGTVVEVLVSDGSYVTAGQPLMVVEVDTVEPIATR